MTDFLYAHPSFLGGMAEAMDLGGTLFLFNESGSPEEADYLAMKSDWMAVGEDIRAAMERFAADHGQRPGEQEPPLSPEFYEPANLRDGGQGPDVSGSTPAT